MGGKCIGWASIVETTSAISRIRAWWFTPIKYVWRIPLRDSNLCPSMYLTTLKVLLDHLTTFLNSICHLLLIHMSMHSSTYMILCLNVIIHKKTWTLYLNICSTTFLIQQCKHILGLSTF
jgi:hypothetical protein